MRLGACYIGFKVENFFFWWHCWAFFRHCVELGVNEEGHRFDSNYSIKPPRSVGLRGVFAAPSPGKNEYKIVRIIAQQLNSNQREKSKSILRPKHAPQLFEWFISLLEIFSLSSLRRYRVQAASSPFSNLMKFCKQYILHRKLETQRIIE